MAFPNLITKLQKALQRIGVLESSVTTINSSIQSLTTNVNSKASKSHAVDADTFGLGTGSVFGHVKLSDATDSTSAAGSSIAATPKAVKAAMDKATDAYDLASRASGGASGCVPLAGGTMTGTLKMPTPAAKLNDTTVATTAWVHREMLNIVYPVGSIYMSVNNVSPSSFLGGTWAALSGRFLIAANSTYTAGSTGGAATHKIVVDELPKHTHTITVNTSGKHTHERGTMNITGSFQLRDDAGTIGCFVNAKKAFSTTDNNRNWRLRCTEQHVAADVLNFNAADGWTGKTSEVAAHGHTATASSTGSSAAMPIMPPYLAVYMWKRTA